MDQNSNIFCKCCDSSIKQADAHRILSFTEPLKQFGSPVTSFFCDRVTVRIVGQRTSDLPPRGPARNHVIRRESSVDLSNQIEEKPKTADSNSDHLGGVTNNGYGCNHTVVL